jgi:hypothetical protein
MISPFQTDWRAALDRLARSGATAGTQRNRSLPAAPPLSAIPQRVGVAPEKPPVRKN